MNLYKISQKINNGYDTFSDAIVAAKTEQEARYMHPRGEAANYHGKPWYEDEDPYDDWASPKDVTVERIGLARPGTEKGVILASFHAG
jgi:hypothetical protein